MNSNIFQSPKASVVNNYDNHDLYAKPIRILIYILAAINTWLLGHDIYRFISGSMQSEIQLIGISTEFLYAFSKLIIITSLLFIIFRLRGLFLIYLASILIVFVKLYLYISFINEDWQFDKSIDPISSVPTFADEIGVTY